MAEYTEGWYVIDYDISLASYSNPISASSRIITELDLVLARLLFVVSLS